MIGKATDSRKRKRRGDPSARTMRIDCFIFLPFAQRL
jgi:hypothetical protein